MTSTSNLPLIDDYFTDPDLRPDPFDEIEWEVTDAVIKNGDKIIFEQKDVEFPAGWSENARNIVAQKYFRGRMGSDLREYSVKQMVDRVARTITRWGIEKGYFPGVYENGEFGTPGTRRHTASIFYQELKFILVNQLAAFNSPVWFNVGHVDNPQCSACFILSVEDSMEGTHGIKAWQTQETDIFRGGSGSGVNLSKIRASTEHLSRGGLASGPVSFMRGADAWAGTISSGGATRRAAKMVVLDVDHPDIEEFIDSKAVEEDRLAVLKAHGLIDGIDQTAAVGSYQNANNSVRVTDLFMEAVEDGEDWGLVNRVDGSVAKKVSANKLMDKIAAAAWRCADPGIQFDTTINEWHTSPSSGRINASNPCSEYMHVDDSACNLASINVGKFFDFENKSFDVASFKHTVDVLITAMDIIVDSSRYPTPSIEQGTKAHRQLGLGYANIGASLMALGVPYGSPEGRSIVAGITSLMTARAYVQSGHIAAKLGPYEAWNIEGNAEAHHKVLFKHAQDNRIAFNRLAVADYNPIAEELLSVAADTWDRAQDIAAESGMRNAQASVIAPTGTISFLMDCDTTGIEPDFSLVKYKSLSGGGMITIVNRTVPLALKSLGYDKTQVAELVDTLETSGVEAFMAGLKEEHKDVFKTANDLTYHEHIDMMAAAQPFLSGAISKTVNMPSTATVEDIKEAYIYSWRSGIKALAIYRDGSKGAQPLNVKVERKDEATEEKVIEKLVEVPKRRRLPSTRQSITHKFSIGGHEGYITAGLYEDGTVGEIFLSDVGKDGSTLLGMMNAFATSISIGLQHGVPMEDLVRKFVNRQFEPRGITTNPEIPFSTSILDYVMKWLASQFGSADLQHELGLKTEAAKAMEADRMALVAEHEGAKPKPSTAPAKVTRALSSDGPPCGACGSIMQRTGACHTCPSCGATTGCG